MISVFFSDIDVFWILAGSFSSDRARFFHLLRISQCQSLLYFYITDSIYKYLYHDCYSDFYIICRKFRASPHKDKPFLNQTTPAAAVSNYSWLFIQDCYHQNSARLFCLGYFILYKLEILSSSVTFRNSSWILFSISN